MLCLFGLHYNCTVLLWVKIPLVIVFGSEHCSVPKLNNITFICLRDKYRRNDKYFMSILEL